MTLSFKPCNIYTTWEHLCWLLFLSVDLKVVEQRNTLRDPVRYFQGQKCFTTIPQLLLASSCSSNFDVYLAL